MNQRGRRCVAALVAAVALQVAGERGAAVPASSLHLHYHIEVAWIDAGEIVMRLSRNGARYTLSGRVATSRMMDRFFRWRGHFVAAGRMAAGMPRTDAYLLWGDDGEEQEMLLSFSGKTNIVKSTGEALERPQPPGSDFMSMTFLAPHCLEETTLHDGEDLYRLVLEGQANAVQLKHRSPYYTGVADRCDYRFRYTNGRTRRLSLWVAHWRGERLPVRVRVRFPFLPDGNLLLRTGADDGAADVVNPLYRRGDGA